MKAFTDEEMFRETSNETGRRAGGIYKDYADLHIGRWMLDAY